MILVNMDIGGDRCLQSSFIHRGYNDWILLPPSPKMLLRCTVILVKLKCIFWSSHAYTNCGYYRLVCHVKLLQSYLNLFHSNDVSCVCFQPWGASVHHQEVKYIPIRRMTDFYQCDCRNSKRDGYFLRLNLSSVVS